MTTDTCPHCGAELNQRVVKDYLYECGSIVNYIDKCETIASSCKDAELTRLRATLKEAWLIKPLEWEEESDELQELFRAKTPLGESCIYRTWWGESGWDSWGAYVEFHGEDEQSLDCGDSENDATSAVWSHYTARMSAGLVPAVEASTESEDDNAKV